MLRKLRNYLAVAILAATPGVTLLTPVMVHAAADTCTWTGAGSDDNFTTAANWSVCDNGTVPESGDALVFPVTAVNLVPNNDLVGATFTSITFNGTSGGGQGYAITGNSFTLAGNLTDSSDQDNLIDTDIVVSGPSTLTVADQHVIVLTGTISGAGSLVKAGDGSVVIDGDNGGAVTLTGALTVNEGFLRIPYGTGQTYSGITVASDGLFGFSGNYTTPYVVSVPITLGGWIDFTNENSGSPARVINITGAITLTADSTFGVEDNVTVNINGPMSGTGFVLGAMGSATAAVNNNNTGLTNTTATPNGALEVESGSGAVPETPTATPAAPAAPDTGFALVSAHPVVTLAITLAATAAILAAARMTRVSSLRR